MEDIKEGTQEERRDTEYEDIAKALQKQLAEEFGEEENIENEENEGIVESDENIIVQTIKYKDLITQKENMFQHNIGKSIDL